MSSNTADQQKSADTQTSLPEPELEVGPATGTLSGEELVDLAERAGDTESADEASSGQGTAVKAAAEGRKLSPEGQSEALKWFLNPDLEAEEKASTETLMLNFGTDEKEKQVPWTVKGVDMETIRAIRNAAQNTRRTRRTGEADEHKVNLSVVVAGTVDPPIMEACAEVANATGKAVDPVQYLKDRFRTKPGFIAQIAGKIMSLSGFDADDVQEADQIEAAGNS